MDYADFVSGRVWLKVVWGIEPDPNEPPEYQTPQVTIRFAYTPAAVEEKDIPLLVQFDRIRVLEAEGLLDDPPEPPAENRAQRRAREKAQQRADATPAGRELGITAIDYLARFVVDWDLTWKGEPWPPCEASFRTLEPALRMEMVATIVRDYLERPSRASSLMRSLGETRETGRSTETSSSNPAGLTVLASPRGSTEATPNGVAVLSGTSGSPT